MIHKSGAPDVVSGTVQDLLDNATKSGKILNGLDFPIFNGSLDVNPYATDITAWHATLGIHCVDPTTPYPTSDMAYGLASLEDSFTAMHLDAEGLATKNKIEVGAKAWGVAYDPFALKLSSIDFFTHPGFRLDEVLKDSMYEMELIILEDGDMLYVFSLPLML